MICRFTFRFGSRKKEAIIELVEHYINLTNSKLKSFWSIMDAIDSQKRDSR